MRRQIPFLLSCIFITACAVAEVPQTVDKHYAIQGRAELEAMLGDGSIHARSCGGCQEIHVHLEMNSADRSRYRLEELQSGNHVRFELKQNEGRGWNWGRLSGKGPELTVEVPQEAAVDLGSGSGDVVLNGVRGNVGLHTGSGDVSAKESAGTITLKTGSGSVLGDNVSGSVDARSGSGDIRIHGSISRVEAHTGSGTLDIGVGNLENGGTLTSGSGDVTLRLSRSTRANVHVSTGSGSIHSDLPITSQGDLGERHDLNGTLNGGGAPLRVTSGSGSIRLQAE